MKDIPVDTIQGWIDQLAQGVDGEFTEHAKGYREALRNIRDRLQRFQGQVVPPKPKRNYTVTDKCRANWDRKRTKEAVE